MNLSREFEMGAYRVVRRTHARGVERDGLELRGDWGIGLTGKVSDEAERGGVGSKWELQSSELGEAWGLEGRYVWV